MAGRYDFDLDQGATFNRTIQIKDKDSQAVDISASYSFAGQIRTTPTSADTEASFTFTIVDGTNGILGMKLSATESAAVPAQQCVYDVEMTQPNSEVVRLLEGFVNVKANVTR
tara:strand:- start:1925 stop:2263 length:339 start_codon:yes stop_codon:yes gene_type:complete